MPATAAIGVRVDVEWHADQRFFERWSVRAVTRTRVDVAHSGDVASFAPVEWVPWLLRQAARGPLTCHLPGCPISWCRGCDGRLVRNGKAPRAQPPLHGNPMANTDLIHRDARILRAAHDVLRNYHFTRKDLRDTAEVVVAGGTHPWLVKVSVRWEFAPRCNCPDAERGANRGYCKHVIAVLLREDDLRPQLLDLFL